MGFKTGTVRAIVCVLFEAVQGEALVSLFKPNLSNSFVSNSSELGPVMIKQRANSVKGKDVKGKGVKGKNVKGIGVKGKGVKGKGVTGKDEDANNI
ncbi:hypothetical protein Tco_1296406 [Tanacetum coccineum]